MNDKLTTSTKLENRLRFYWEIVTHFGNFSCSNWEKKILFSFGNYTGNRSPFHREKNQCSIIITMLTFFLHILHHPLLTVSGLAKRHHFSGLCNEHVDYKLNDRQLYEKANTCLLLDCQS